MQQRIHDVYRASTNPHISARAVSNHYSAYEDLKNQEELEQFRQPIAILQNKLNAEAPGSLQHAGLTTALTNARQKMYLRQRQMEADAFYKKQQLENPDFEEPSAPPA